MTAWMADFAYATRRLIRSPGFSATALVILVLGIGVNTLAFTFVNALLFQPPPFEEPSEVVFVLQDSDGGTPNSTSYPAYLDMRRYDDVFASLSAFNSDQAFLDSDGVQTPMLVEYATAGYMEVIGLEPSRGRWFDASMDDPLGPPAIVLTYNMWRDRFGSDPDIVGRTVRIGGAPIPVIGVGPTTFHGGVGPAGVQMWLSISAMGPTGGRSWSLERRQDHPFQVRARLAPGVSPEQAQVAMTGLATELATTYPELNTGRDITVIPVLDQTLPPGMADTVVPVTALAMAVVVVVLLIATLNLANLLLVRTTARTRELAVRLALGAGRVRLIRIVVAEALLLAFAGGAGAIAVAYAISNAVRNSWFDLGLQTPLELGVDLRVLLFAAVASITTGLVFGLVPALRATSGASTLSVHGEAGNAIGAGRRFGLTGGLVAAQVAASLLLLAVSGVFLDSLARAQGADPGFDWERTAHISLSLQPLELDAGGTALLQDRIRERLAALPGVEAVTHASSIPAALYGTTTLLLGSGIGGVDRPTETSWNVVAPGYFDVLGIPLLAGRAFDERDRDGPTVAIVSEAMARTYWGRTDVVGESYRSENDPDAPVEIVGVVGNAPVRSLGETPTPTVYFASDGALRYVSWVVRTVGEPQASLSALRNAVLEVDDRILVLEATTTRAHLGETLETRRFAGALLGGLGGLALLLALLGLYGVVSYAVSRRRHEVGIRIALGAGRDSVVGLIVRDVAGVVVAGAVVGLLISIPATALVARVFTGGGGVPRATVAAALLLLGTALLATIVPATRAARTDPRTALRVE